MDRLIRKRNGMLDMFRLIGLVCVLLLLNTIDYSNSSFVLAEEPTKQKFRIVGYLPEYRFADYDPASFGSLTDVILFSAQPKLDGHIDASKVLDGETLSKWRTESNKHVRFHLCVGGWERSEHFAVVAASPAKRRVFVENAIELCKKHGLSGVDLDWEHPKDEKEQEAYAALIKDLRSTFAPIHLTVSVTLAAWQNLPKQAFQDADWVQIMAYDHEGKHSTLQGAMEDVEKVIQQGANPSKITLGVPFYGRSVVKSGQTLTYREIQEKFHPDPESDEVKDIYFNGRKTIAAKTEWARSHGLAGVMIWEIGQDAAGSESLLQAIVSSNQLPSGSDKK